MVEIWAQYLGIRIPPFITKQHKTILSNAAKGGWRGERILCCAAKIDHPLTAELIKCML